MNDSFIIPEENFNLQEISYIVKYLKKKQYRADDTELSGLISEAH